MENEKKLTEIFSRYQPGEIQREILLSAENVRLRADRVSRMIEIHASFPQPLEKSRLYELEAGIAEAYELQSVRILPHYPAECFDASYIPQVLAEAERVGIVARGFFTGAVHTLADNCLTLAIPFAQGGVQLLYDARTPEVIEGIIRSEFGLEIKVTVVRDENAAPVSDWAEAYAALDRKIIQAEQEYHTAKSAPPPPAEEKEDKTANLKKVQTLMNAPPAPSGGKSVHHRLPYL